MAKKKNKEEIVTENNVDVMHYSGTITAKVLRKNKVISTRKFKNNGRWPLFNLFACCLAGKFNEASQNIPKYIRLYSYGNVGDDSPKITELSTMSMFLGNRLSLVDYTYSKEPDVVLTKNIGSGIGSAKVKFSFMIPFTHINAYTGATYKPTTLICLFDEANILAEQDPSAMYFVVDDTNKLSDLVDREKLRTVNSKDYNLYLEWVMEVKN